MVGYNMSLQPQSLKLPKDISWNPVCRYPGSGLNFVQQFKTLCEILSEPCMRGPIRTFYARSYKNQCKEM